MGLLLVLVFNCCLSPQTSSIALVCLLSPRTDSLIFNLGIESNRNETNRIEMNGIETKRAATRARRGEAKRSEAICWKQTRTHERQTYKTHSTTITRRHCIRSSGGSHTWSPFANQMKSKKGMFFVGLLTSIQVLLLPYFTSSCGRSTLKSLVPCEEMTGTVFCSSMFL